MHKADDTPASPKAITLAAGAQAVINGALITAVEPCQLEVGSGAFVLTGRALWRDQKRNSAAAAELYFAMLEVCARPDEFEPARFRLFALLSHVVAQNRTHQSQRECAACAAALIAGDRERALASAQRLAEAQKPDHEQAAGSSRQDCGTAQRPGHT